MKYFESIMVAICILITVILLANRINTNNKSKNSMFDCQRNVCSKPSYKNKKKICIPTTKKVIINIVINTNEDYPNVFLGDAVRYALKQFEIKNYSFIIKKQNKSIGTKK